MKGKRKRQQRPKRKNAQIVSETNQNSGQGKFQAPHHDEPEDLTDDLAPKVSAQNETNATESASTATPQPGPAGPDNKLNFKFQKTVPKTSDWAKHNNMFKNITGTLSDPEAKQEKLENRWDQEQPTDQTNPGFDEDVEMSEASETNRSDLKVAVSTEPFQFLTMLQVKEIHEALANKIQEAVKNSIQSYIPVFQQKPVHDLGYLPLTCQGAQDIMWLHESLTNIESPLPRTKLVVKSQSNIPELIKVGFVVPNFSGNLGELKMFLQKQNHWYDMTSWALIKSEKQDHGSYFLLYGVPEKQVHIIDNRDRRMAYSLGTVFVSVYDAQWNENITDKEFNFRNVAKHLLVSVVTEPFRYLTLLEVDAIELALSRKLEKAICQYETDEYIPTFRDRPSHYKGGLRLWCESDRDLGWLKEIVASIVSPVAGTKLIVKEQIEIPERAKTTIFVPHGNEDEAVIAKVLKSQNTWCNMESWVLFSKEESSGEPGLVLVFYIPIEQVGLIKKNECKLSYLLGYVNVKFDSCFYE